MVKQRFSTSDVVAEVGCLKQRFLGMRLANIYDINAKTYLLKLARSGDEGEKAFIVLESGTRFHTTKWAKEKSDTPSNFTLKLRKHLRTRRLEDVRQLGVDRIVDFTFGFGETCHHLILELFAQGNVILTDSKYEILTLLRSHRDDDKGVAIMARHPYPLQTVRLRVPITPALVTEALANADPTSTLQNLALGLLPYGIALIDHSLLAMELQPQTTVADLRERDQMSLLFEALQIGEELLDSFGSVPSKGYIWQVKEGSQKKAKKGLAHDSQDNSSLPLTYDEYDALPLRQNTGKAVLEFDSLDEALDEFYAKIEGQKAAQIQAQKESAVVSKVEKIRIDQAKRAGNLEREAKEAETKASLIEYNLEAVDGAINAVRAALANNLNWKELKQLIKTEKAAGNPVASLIHSLELEQNKMTVLLSNLLDDEEDDFEALTRPAAKVEIDLDLNAHSNASAHYESKKLKAAKQEKTIQQNAKALQAAEKTAQQKLAQVRSAKTVQQLRKPYWFEKFNWFITSENYLVVSGRDMQQNELLVKRHLRRGDIYVHAELHGASTTIIKNHTPDRPVPHLSISQAGCACVCRSQAWDAKIVTSAWWVAHDQVSKTAPTGEYLPTGSFIIRGKKTFLPPQPLVMALTFLFGLDESSLAGHVGERAVRGLDNESNLANDGGEGSGTEADEAYQTQNLPSGSASTTGQSALDAFMEGAADPLAKASSSDRYGLEYRPTEPAFAPQIGDERGGKDDLTDGPGRRHLSAHERRLRKKPGDGSTQDAEVEEARKAERERCEAKQQASLQAQSVAAANIGRGKKGKAKRAEAKYAHQDEEDRQLALQLLDPAGARKGKADKKEARKARKQAAQEEEEAGLRRGAPTPEELARVGAHIPVRHPRIESEAEQASRQDASGSQPGSAGPSGQTTGNGTVPASNGALESAPVEDTETEEEDSHDEEEGNGVGNPSENEEAEVAAILEDEQVELLPDAEIARLREIDSLTGQPLSNDILHHAIPMCAPISAVQNYKYRLKLTPGSQRKGKAARQAVELFLKSPDMPGRERDLIRIVPEMETINALLGSVKISTPGLQKLQNQARSQKKKAKSKLNS